MSEFYVTHQRPPVDDRHATVAYLALLLASNRHTTLTGVLEQAYDAGHEATGAEAQPTDLTAAMHELHEQGRCGTLVKPHGPAKAFLCRLPAGHERVSMFPHSPKATCPILLHLDEADEQCRIDADQAHDIHVSEHGYYRWTDAGRLVPTPHFSDPAFERLYREHPDGQFTWTPLVGQTPPGGSLTPPTSGE